jgi:hypothetical protein
MSNNLPPEQNEIVARRDGKEVKGIQSIRHTSRGLSNPLSTIHIQKKIAILIANVIALK